MTSPALAAWLEAGRLLEHLPGLHDQRSHGRRFNIPGDPKSGLLHKAAKKVDALEPGEARRRMGTIDVSTPHRAELAKRKADDLRAEARRLGLKPGKANKARLVDMLAEHEERGPGSVAAAVGHADHLSATTGTPPRVPSVLRPGRDRLDEIAALYRDNPVEYEGRRRKSYELPYDQHLKRISEIQGFDAKPQVATREEVDRAVAAGWVETWRGVGLHDKGKTPAEINHDLRFGDYEPGRGLYGNGVYASVRRGTAETFRGRDPKENFPIGDGPDFGPEDYYGDEAPDSMLRIAVDPAARIADFDQISEELKAWRQGLELGSPEGTALADAGRYAAARGYDVMIVKGHGDGAFYPGWETDEVDDEDVGSFPQADQYVILNRSAVMIQRAEDPA